MAALGSIRRFTGVTGAEWDTVGHYVVTVDAESQLASLETERGQVVHCANEASLHIFDGTVFKPVSGGTTIEPYSAATAYAQGDLTIHQNQIWVALVDVPATDATLPVPTTSVEPTYLATQWHVLQRPVLHVQTSATEINPPDAIPGDFYYDSDTKDFGFLSPYQPDINDRTLVLWGAVPPATITSLASLRQDTAHGTAAMAGQAAFSPEQYVTFGTTHYTWDGTNWVVYGGRVAPAGLHRNSGLNENTIRQWIAESSRFRGALEADGSSLVGAVKMRQLPAASTQNTAQYWVASEEIPNPLPGDRAYIDKTADLVPTVVPITEAQIRALTSIPALTALIPPNALAAPFNVDWRSRGWLLELGGVKATFDGTAWQPIVTLDTLKSGDWLQSVGDPMQGVRGFVRIPGGTLTISLADSMYVRQTSPQALPLAAKNDQRLRSRIGAQPVWEDIPPTADQAIKRVLVNTKTANNEVAWSGLWPTHDIHPNLPVSGNWHYRPAQAPFQLGQYHIIGPTDTPTAQGDMSLGADLKVHYKDQSGTDRHIVWEAMIPGNIITVQGVDSSRTMSFQIGGAPTRAGDVVTIPGTLTGSGAADAGSYVVNAINPGPPPDDGALQVIGPMLRVTVMDEDGWMGSQFGQQPPMPGPGSMIKVVDAGDPDRFSVFEAQSVKQHGFDYLDIICSPTVRSGPAGHFIRNDGTVLSIGVDNSPVATVTDVRPGEYLLVGDPGRMPTGSGPDQGKQVTAGDLVQALDRDGDGTIDGYRILTGETPTGVMTMVGVIDDIGAESHTWKWDEVGIPMGYNPPTTNTPTGAAVGQFNFVSTPPTGTGASAHWDKTAKTVAFWETAADTNTAIRQLPNLFKSGNTVLYVGGRNPGSTHTFLLTSVTYANSIVTCTYIGEPGGGATADPGRLEHVAWAITTGKVTDFPPNSYLMVDAVPTDKKVPAGVPGARARTVGIGDWLVAVDTDGDGLSDVWHLLHHSSSVSTATYHLVATATANHTTTWSLADLADDTKVPVGSWVIVSDDVNEMAPAGMSWLDVDGNEYVAGTVHPPRGSLAQKTATNHLVERWAPDQPWRLHITAPPGQPFHSSYAWFNNRNWDWYKVGVPAIVAEVNPQGNIPAMSKFPSLVNEQPAKPGDWLMPMDRNNDGIADDVILVRQHVGTHLHRPAETTPATAGYILLERFPGDTKTGVITDGWVKGRWDILITGQCRSDTNLYLNLHTDAIGNVPADSPPIDRRTPALKSLGPWAVKAGMPFTAHIVGYCGWYGIWQVTFSGQDAAGKRIFDMVTVQDNVNLVRLPVVGMDCDAGGLYLRSLSTHTPQGGLMAAVTVAHSLPTTATTHTGNVGGDSYGTSPVIEMSFTSIPGHEYLITTFVNAMWQTAASSGREYQLEVAGTVIASAWLAANRGAWNGLMSSPMCLSGVWTETATQARSVRVRALAHKESASDLDWKADDGLHTLRVIDCGKP